MTDRSSQAHRVPTVNDLRVKLCYICREEELYDAPRENPPRVWTHPCNCTLVAHEACLLRWIQTSQSDSARAPNALKCPQCGTKYELVSHRPRTLRLLGVGNGILQRAGRVVTLTGAAGIAAVFTTGVLVVLTAYGAWAVEKFLGTEMYELLLTDNVSNWHWTTLLNLPAVPLSLIISRFQSPRVIPSIIPILLVWLPSPPIMNNNRRSRFTNPDTDIRSPPSSTSAISPNAAEAHGLSAWPPAPAAFALFILPAVRVVYRRLWAKVQIWALGAQPPSARAAAHTTILNAGWDGWPVVIRIRANVNREIRNQAPGQGQDGQDQGQGQEQGQNGAQQQEQQAAQQQGRQEEAAIPEDQQALAAAEQQVSISASSFGRRIGGALLVPYISSRMGSLLLSLSKRSHILRRILGVRPPLSRAQIMSWPNAYYGMPLGEEWKGFGSFMKLMGAVWRATLVGSRPWIEADPVWWRNAIGLGLFVVAKDAVELLHLWLTLRELESRRVKNRDFSGVDIRELDLIPSFPRP